MEDLGLLSGYHYREFGLQVYNRADAEEEATKKTQWAAEKAVKDPYYANKPPTECRVVSVREELSECAIYASYCGEFEKVGIFADYEKR